MKTLLFHAREAGVASMMQALVHPLQNAGFTIMYDVSDHAAEILNPNNTGHIEEADLVICGYDSPLLDRTGDFLSKLPDDLPTLGLLDSWKGVDRFWYADGSLRPLTDRIAVPDKSIRSYLLSRNMPQKLPVATGHPGLERLLTMSQNERAQLKQCVHEQLEFIENENVILLLSEPVNIEGNIKSSLLDVPVGGKLTVKSWLESKYGEDYKIAVRFHPLEQRSVPANWLDVSDIEFDLVLALGCKICGLGSTTLAYAVAYGAEVMCLDQDVNDWKPEDSDIPYSLWKNLIECGVFQNDSKRTKHNDIKEHEGSIARITNEIYSLLNMAEPF